MPGSQLQLQIFSHTTPGMSNVPEYPALELKLPAASCQTTAMACVCQCKLRLQVLFLPRNSLPGNTTSCTAQSAQGVVTEFAD